ncbi:MAG: hypothetical protein P4L53_20210 [Candidatus Obscuribacterales bacterium]|nr:hypothetical protein [Candidatus Obscuribacterales bacterium]
MNFTFSKEPLFKLDAGRAFLANHIAALMLSVGLGIFCCSASTAAAPAKNLTAWKLDQIENLLGHRIVYISDKGIKYFYAKQNYSLLYAAPDWQLKYFNSDRKAIFSTTVEQWLSSTNFRLKLVKGNYLPENPVIIKGLEGVVAGHKVQYFVVKPIDKGHTAKKADGATVVETRWDVAEDIPIVPQISKLQAAMTGKAVGSNFPLSICVLMGDGAMKRRLTTIAVEKVQVPADFFDAPKNYRTVNSESEITLGSGLINDLVDDLGKGLGR